MKIAHTRVTVALEQVLQRSPRARPTCAYLPHSDTATHGPYCSTPREVHTCIFSLNFLSYLFLLLSSFSVVCLIVLSSSVVSSLCLSSCCSLSLSLSRLPVVVSCLLLVSFLTLISLAT